MSKLSYFLNPKLPQIANKIARITAKKKLPQKLSKALGILSHSKGPIIDQSIQLDLPWS